MTPDGKRRKLNDSLLFDQLGDFSLIGKSLPFNVLFGVNQLAVAFYIENTATTPD
jgi:hypothetical protein